MSESGHAHIKHAPSLSQLLKALQSLSDPSKVKTRYADVSIDSDGNRKIRFERIKILKSDGEKIAKWSYDGRLIIDSKFLFED